MELLLSVLVAVVLFCSVAGVTIFFVSGTAGDTLNWIRQTRLKPAEIKEFSARKKEKKARDEALNEEFESFSEGAKRLLSHRKYAHYCSKHCGEFRYDHDRENFSREFAEEDYESLIEDNEAQEHMKNGEFDALMKRTGLLEPRRMKRKIGANLVESITEKEWALIHQEYNETMLGLINTDNRFHAVLNTVKTDNQDSFKEALIKGEEQKKLSAMTAKEMREASWSRSFETV